MRSNPTSASLDVVRYIHYDTIHGTTGDERPLRVLCCGYSLGGSLATLAAVWSALQMPMADIRCVTLQAPKCVDMVIVLLLMTWCHRPAAIDCRLFFVTLRIC